MDRSSSACRTMSRTEYCGVPRESTSAFGVTVPGERDVSLNGSFTSSQRSVRLDARYSLRSTSTRVNNVDARRSLPCSCAALSNRDH